VHWPFVDIRNWFVFGDGTTLASDATLSYREHQELRVNLDAAGFDTVQIKDVPERLGRERIVLARLRRVTPTAARALTNRRRHPV
jgi:hypothetical protein